MGGRPSTFDPARTYAFLEDEGGAVVLPGGAEFWSALAAGPPFPPDVGRVVSGSGWLAALYALDVDGAAWERHPNGAELLLMVTGEMDLVLEGPGGEVTVRMPAGRAFVVPRGAWHRQVVRVPGTYVGVTFGKGSEHRPLGEVAARGGRRAPPGRSRPAPRRRTAKR